MIFTFDLDSTLYDTGHRQLTLLPGVGNDWAAYAAQCTGDTLIEATAALAYQLSFLGQIYYVSGRDNSARGLTEAKLKEDQVDFHAGLILDDETQGEPWGPGGHAEYKLRRLRQLEAETDDVVRLHVDDWSEVKVLLEANGIPCLCVRTPQEIEQLVRQPVGRHL